MRISQIAFWVTVAVWLVQAGLSQIEGTLCLEQLLERKVEVSFHGRYRWQHLPMSFLNNWSVSIGDLFFISTFNGLVVPHLWPMAGWWWKYPLCFFCAIAATWVIHKAWWRHDENLGHVFASWEKSGRQDKNWQKDVTMAGRVHYLFMVIQVAVMLVYIITPMPGVVVFGVNALLSVFFIIQNAQAVLIQEGFWPNHFFIAAVELAAVWAMAIVKMT